MPFKKGDPPGPGRPKGSRSTTTVPMPPAEAAQVKAILAAKGNVEALIPPATKPLVVPNPQAYLELPLPYIGIDGKLPEVPVDFPIRSARAAMDMLELHASPIFYNACIRGMARGDEDSKFWAKLFADYTVAKPQSAPIAPRDNILFITQHEIGPNGYDPMAKRPEVEPEAPPRRSLAEALPDRDDDLVPA